MVAVLLTAPPPGAAQTIGVFFDAPAGSTCAELAAPGVFEVEIAFVAGGGVDSIRGAELRLDIPDHWELLSTTPDTSVSLFLGEPLGPFGIAIALATCRSGPIVPLFRAEIRTVPPLADQTLAVVPQAFCPGGTSCPAPIVSLCDDPIFTKVFVRGAVAHVRGVGGCAVVAVRPATWSVLKRTYQ